MKRQLVIGCLAVAVLAGCSSMGQRETASHSPRAADIRTALDRAVIPTVDFENLPVDQALLRWSQMSMQHHPLHFKFPYKASYQPPPSQALIAAAQTAAANRPANADQAFASAKTSLASQSVPTQFLPKVTVRRRDITSKRVLDEICSQANLVWTITGRVIMLRPSNLPPELH